MDSQNKCLQELNLLTSSQHWDKMEKYLDLLIAGQNSALLNAESIEAVKEAQGRIKAYNSIRALPNTIRAMKESGIRN